MQLTFYDWHPTLIANERKMVFEVKDNLITLLEALRLDSNERCISYYREPDRFDFKDGKLLLSSNIEMNTSIMLRRYREMSPNNVHAAFYLKIKRGRLNIESTPYKTVWCADLWLRWAVGKNYRTMPVQHGWNYGEYSYGKLKKVPQYMKELTRLAMNERQVWQDWLNDYGERGEILR